MKTIVKSLPTKGLSAKQRYEQLMQARHGARQEALSELTRDLVQCAAREVALRRNAYPKFVRAGRMTEAQALREISLMQAIVEELKRVAKLEAEIAELKTERQT